MEFIWHLGMLIPSRTRALHIFNVTKAGQRSLYASKLEVRIRQNIYLEQSQTMGSSQKLFTSFFFISNGFKIPRIVQKLAFIVF